MSGEAELGVRVSGGSRRGGMTTDGRCWCGGGGGCCCCSSMGGMRPDDEDVEGPRLWLLCRESILSVNLPNSFFIPWKKPWGHASN